MVKNKKGFTLIELLVVLAIIGVGAGVLTGVVLLFRILFKLGS